MYVYRIKKFIILLSGITSLSIAGTSSVQAQDANAYLKMIAENTYAIMQSVNDLPSYLKSASQLVLAWLNPDNSKATGAMQGSFTQLGNVLTQDLETQVNMQPALNNDLLNNDGNNVNNANNATSLASGLANATTLWYANDLVYSTLLGAPYFGKDNDPRKKSNDQQKPKKIDSAYNYIKNASGLNVYHPIPGSNWGGSATAKLRYQNYYNTIMSVSSFNAYVLSNQYADNYQFNTLQTTLIKQASDPQNWFAQVASENIGFVLRQILLYQSQSFVLLTQLVQYQKQAVTAQVMTNAVLIASNQMNENVLVANAKGQQPSM